jgi:hypothetical protein
MSKLSEHLNMLLRMQEYESPHVATVLKMSHYTHIIGLCDSINHNYVIIGPKLKEWKLTRTGQPVLYSTVDEVGKPYICGCWKTVDGFLADKGLETSLPYFNY